MNHKALVEIFVPAAGQTYDVYLPLESKMSEVIPLVAAALNDLSGGKFEAGGDAILCNAQTGAVSVETGTVCMTDVNKELAVLGIHNGSRLMLI